MLKKNKICNKDSLDISKGRRHCKFCDSVIIKGESFYKIVLGYNYKFVINICEKCSWVQE